MIGWREADRKNHLVDVQQENLTLIGKGVLKRFLDWHSTRNQQQQNTQQIYRYYFYRYEEKIIVLSTSLDLITISTCNIIHKTILHNVQLTIHYKNVIIIATNDWSKDFLLHQRSTQTRAISFAYEIEMSFKKYSSKLKLYKMH